MSDLPHRRSSRHDTMRSFLVHWFSICLGLLMGCAFLTFIGWLMTVSLIVGIVVFAVGFAGIIAAYIEFY